MRNLHKLVIVLSFAMILSCGAPHDPNYLGHVDKLPPGKYVIYAYGSRHNVRCVKPDGTYYHLNDSKFKNNGITGYDAHQYRNKTQITIK